MPILKMQAVTIAGRIDTFDEVVKEYIEGRQIHLEDAMSALDNKKLFSYAEDNRYHVVAKSIFDVLSAAGLLPKETMCTEKEFTLEQMTKKTGEITELIEESRQERFRLEKQIGENQMILRQLDTMIDFDVDLPRLFEFEFLKFRFGRIPRLGYKTLNTYLDDLDAVFIKTAEDENDIWGFYFMPAALEDKIDAVFASLYFERIMISDKVTGTPRQSKAEILREIDTLKEQIQRTTESIKESVKTSYLELSDMYLAAKERQRICEVKKSAAHTRDFFYIVGWMPKREAKRLEAESDRDERIVVVVEEPEEVTSIRPPTKLKNIALFRPFELFVKMYGLPSYGEIDPTPILAVTYMLLFGIMFGDVGQSLLFAIVGFLIYKIKKIDLAAIVSLVGVTGTAFGFVYGSLFGNEEILAGVRLIEPMDKISFMLMGAVAIGIFLIIFCMIVNMVNAVRQRRWGKLLFSQNGLSGLLFYGVLLVTVASVFLFGGMKLPVWLTVLLLIVPFLAIFMQEPLSQLLSGKKNWFPKSGMFYVENFFEMFDVLLSYITNTISFLRVGAFAIIHVGMMMVVGVLARQAGGAGVVVQVIGNGVVMGLEGLIVGIQVLRLEYYEMFSRYFEGEGKQFHQIEK